MPLLDALKNLGSGAASGAATGASLGSFIPGWGTLAGAGAGALLGGLGTYLATRKSQPGEGSFLGGTPSKMMRETQMTPEQIAAQNQILQMTMRQLQANPLDFRPIEAHAREQFSKSTVPTLASRFTSATGGALSSPQLYGQLGAAGADLESELAALKSQYGLAAHSNLANLLGLGLRPQFQNIYFPAQPGALQTALPSLLQTGGSLLGTWLQGRQAQNSMDMLLDALKGSQG